MITFVENDWMEAEIDWMNGQKMTEAAQYKVGTRFAEHNIELHIDARPTPMNQRSIHILGNRFPADDGDMGGVNDHQEKISDWTWATDQRYFDHQDQKFHYVLMAHHPEDQPEWYEFWEGDPLGVANSPGDELTLFDENLVSAEDQAHVFLHELTHNLIGQYDSTGDYWGHNPDADHLIDTDDNDPWGEHCPNGHCALQTRLSSGEREKIINLCDDCWHSIKLRYSF